MRPWRNRHRNPQKHLLARGTLSVFNKEMENLTRKSYWSIQLNKGDRIRPVIVKEHGCIILFARSTTEGCQLVEELTEHLMF